MIFLPIVERELRVASRRLFTYWGRLLATLLGIGLTAWILLVFGTFGSPNGATVFRGLSILVFVYAGLGGIHVTSDSLSKERRENTLGLLFLTDLTGYDIVIGKLVATGINLLYAMLALLPVLALALVLGAVTLGDVVRVSFVSLNLLFFFCNLGLAASSLCRRANQSIALAIAFTLILNVACLAGFQFPGLHASLLTSPARGCFLAFDEFYHLNPVDFWIAALFTQLYAWGFFVFACWFVPRSWQDESQSKASLKPAVENILRRDRLRRVLLEVNPFLWRASRPEIKRWLVWLATLTAGAGWVCMDHFRFRPVDDLFILILTGTVFKIWLAADASWTLAEDRRQGALQLILTTLLEPEEIVSGQRASLWRQFAGPVIVLLMANVLFLTIEVQRSARGAFAELVWLHLIAGASLVLELAALAWVAMWQGLSNRKSNRAVLWAVLRIVAAPYLLFFAILFLYSTSGPPGRLDWTALLIFPGIFGVGVDFFFALEANSKLLALFRLVASEGYERKRFSDDEEEQPAPVLATVK
ncbi:MAG TPA: ABC transporter permease subunit [Verrucomicrobiae bacterium]|jgi:ABC-type transport system involved in multi-copper enzyme maturation permease subunit|nr:ABC transporter permease subunit [Verrucomicrobiae bacterium]